MIQRGLAVLLSVCMLAGGVSDTVYAINSQSDTMTVSSAQDVSNARGGVELPTEDTVDNLLVEDEEQTETNQEENGGSAGNSAEIGNSSGIGSVEDGTDGAGSGSSDGGSMNADDNETGDETGSGDNVAEDETGKGDNTPVDGTGSNDGPAGDGADSEGDAALDGMEEDGNAAESGSDVTVSGNDADAEGGLEDETGMEADEALSSVSVLSVKEEELLLTVDSPQTVTLAEAEKQWLSFTAPQDGLYRFYSTAEDGSYQYKEVYLFHEKSDDEYGYFGQDYASEQDGNFSYTYRMQADETVYLRVEFDSASTSGTFTVHAEKVEASELTVTKNDEGSYTLQSDSYQLNLVFTPSYSTVKVEMELRQADGSALGVYGSYKVYGQYAYDTSWGSKNDSDNTQYLSPSAYKASLEFTNIASGGELLITDLQIRDSSNHVLAALGTGGQAISVNTLTTDKQGVLTQVTAEDTSISVRAEIIGNHNARLRYRKAEESEWTYYKNTIYYYNNNAIMLAAEPDTDYVIELTATDLETVYDTAEIRTKAFAASDIHAEVTDITSSGATIKVTVGTYTGSNQYIRARVSYVDSMGETQTGTGYLYVRNIETGSINLTLHNLAAGTEYKDLQVELDDTDDYSMQYAAYRTSVSFTTEASVLTTEQIDVTVTPDAENGTQAVLKVALQDVTEGSYPYTVKYRVAGSKDWQDGKSKTGSLSDSNSYADEQNLTSLMGNTEYEVQVMVDGISKAASFTTTSAAVAAAVEVQPLMSGVQVTAALTGTEALTGSYTVSAQYYDQDTGRWQSTYYIDYNNTQLTEDNNWAGTIVLYSENMRPNAVNDWKITINGNTGKVYEQYFSLKAVSREISMTAERIMCTTAQIRAVLAARDESLRSVSDELYYRVKGTSQWTDAGTCYYYNEDGGTVYLNGLKEDTEYEVKLVPEKYPEDILAQMTFRTLKDTRSLSVSVDNCRYTSAQVNWTFDSGTNVLDSSSYICLYYREKGAAAWSFLNSRWQTTTYTGKESLKDLEPGTSYEVLAEIKDSSLSSTAGQNVVRDIKAEFATVAVDHELKAELVTQATDAASATFDMQLTKKTGVLESRAKADVILVSADGSSTQYRTVYFSRDNEYKTKLKVSGLLPGTKYTVSAKLYESENNTWVSLKNFALGEVTTAEAKAPTALTISEQELVLNKGTSKKLTVTAQPQEAAAGLTWTSSDETVATVGRDGTVTARKAGGTDITVTASGAADDGKEKVSAVSHVTVKDYVIRVKNTDGSYDNFPSLLSKTQKRTLVVYDAAADMELTGVTWLSSNPNAAKISAEGLLEPQNYGRTYITAKTADAISIKTAVLNVVNEIQGFSITRPEAGNDAYRAIKTADAVYQVAAGETYEVGCVLSPAYTDQYDSSVSMAGDRFTWSSDNNAVTIKVSEYDNDITGITIPESVSGPVKVTAVMKDEEYAGKSFTITLDVLKKPEVEMIPASYTWLDYSSKLAGAELPDHWQWKEQDTLLYETGMKTFTARYMESGYYPYETEVPVYVEKVGSSLSVIGDYSAGKKAYVVKKESLLKVRINARAENIPIAAYEQSALAPAAKDAAKVSVSEPDADGYYSVTASVKGTYTVSAAVSLRKAAFEKKDGAYVLTAGEKVKDTSFSVKFMVVDSAPIKTITFAVAEDSPEQVTIGKDGTIEYKITAANADTKNSDREIHLNVSATDADGNKVENPNINYTVSDAAVVKQKKEGTNRLILTIPRGADGLAKIIATAKDELGYSTQLAVRVKDFTPRVTTYTTALNENCSLSVQMAQVVLPYLEEEGDQIKTLSLVKTNSQEGRDKVAGLAVRASSISGVHKYGINLSVEDKEKIESRGSLNYYLAITTEAYGGIVFVPVKIKLETGIPAVTVKQTSKVNVFYTDTTHLTGYDAVSMGLVQFTSSARIASVVWRPGEGAVDASAVNSEFEMASYTSVLKNGKYTASYKIQQHKPILNSSKKPADTAVKGNVYIYLSGYSEPVKKPLTIQTEYKKPKLKVADYKVCPALGEMSDWQYIYTNAAKTNNYMVKGSSTVWRGYSDIICADEEIGVTTSSPVGLTYSGTKDKKTELTLYSDYWYESLTVPVKIKVAKSKVKLSPAAVTLNTAYPSEATQTTASTRVYNAATGTYVNISDVMIEGANAQSQQLLDQSLLNMDYMNPYLSVSVNYAKAMGNNQFKPGTYKYKLTPYYGDTELNGVTLAVKIIDKEAAVKVKAKGTIDLLKVNWNGDSYDNDSSNSVVVTPTFKNLDSSYSVDRVELDGAYKDLFRISEYYSKGSLRIVPSSFGKLKAGKSYTLSVKYTIKDANGEGGETITVMSNTFTVKPKQSVPKVTSSVKQLTLYASAKGESKAETMSLYVPHSNYKAGYYAIQNASGLLDVNKDGKADLIVKTNSLTKSSGRAQIAVYVLDADAIKATDKGVTYKIPVTVQCVGRDGVSKDASATVSVVVKK